MHRRWEKEFCKGLSLLFFFFTVSGSTYAAPADSAKAGEPVAKTAGTASQKRIVRLNADINWTLGISAADFFKDYQSLLRGPASGFDAPVGFSVGMSTYQVRNAPIGLMVSYSRAVVRESFLYTPAFGDSAGLPAQTYSESIAMTAIPMMLTWDYYPIDRQFTGYIGGGVGAAAIHMNWTEGISESTSISARQGGVRYDAWGVAPLAMARVGVSLGFDEPISAKAKSGVYFEASYLFMPLSAPLFKETASTLINPPARTSQNYTTQAGGFVVRIGLNVFFLGK